MVAEKTESALDQTVIDGLALIIRSAEKDAERAVAFLAATGLAPAPGKNHTMPGGVLMDIGSITRLRDWENSGIHVHLEAGLPTAAQALMNLISDLGVADERPEVMSRFGELSRAVFVIMMTRFAWRGQQDLRADIVLEFPDEDTLIDSMARFIWSQRDQLSAIDEASS